MDLDETDRRILRALREDARLSMRELGAKVGVSGPTATARVKALEAMGIIRGYRAVLDPARLPGVVHLVELEAPPALAGRVAEALARVPGVEDVVEVAGGRVFARHTSEGATEPLLDALRAIPDVASFRVHPVVGGREVAARVPLALRVPCHFCGGAIDGPGHHKRWEADGSRDHWFCCGTCESSFGARLRSLTVGAKGAPREKTP